MNILSIQSWVAFGHVGNAAAVFPLQRLGHEVWALNTVQFSNHTGYGQWRGQVFGADHLRDVIEGIAERNGLEPCDAVLSGYLGDASIGEVVMEAVKRVRTVHPGALYCCDPVMGDFGRGVFVREGIPEMFANSVVPMADIVTPNQFELEMLARTEVSTLAEAVAAARAVQAMGPRFVAVTSLRPPAVAEGRLGNLLVADDAVWLVDTPQLDFPIPPNGAGDAFAAMLLGRLIGGETPDSALAGTVSALFAVLKRTLEMGRRELALIPAQHELAQPVMRFEARKVA